MNQIFNIFQKKPYPLITTSIDTSRPIREQALQFFEEIKGLDSVKENLFRSLISEDQTNTALIGPPATGKTLLTDVIAKKCSNVVKFDASNSTSAGLFEVLKLNTSAKILIIDEIDKLNKKDQGAILSLLNDGTVTKTLKGEVIRIVIKGLKTVVTANTLTKLIKPLKSRLEQYTIKEYTDEEFIETAMFCLGGKMSMVTSGYIAKVLLEAGKKDIRAVLSIAKKVQKQDTQEDVRRIVENWIEYQSTEEINYN